MKKPRIVLSVTALAMLLGASACQPFQPSSAPPGGISTPSTRPATAEPTATPRPTRTGFPLQLASATPGAAPTAAPLREPMWTFPTGGEIWSSPAVHGGTVFFGSDDHKLYALDLSTRAPKWTYEAGDRVRARPAVADGAVYFTGDDNYLYALEEQTGKELWKFDLGRTFQPRVDIPDSYDYQQSSPAVANGVVYVGSAGAAFFAVDAKTGTEKWRARVIMHVRSSPAVADGIVYFGDWNGTVYALRADTGRELWRFDTYGAIVPSPTVAGGVVYIGSKFPAVFALDARSGAELWRFKYPEGIPWVESSAAVADGLVVVGSSDWKKVVGIEADNGDLRWSFRTVGDPWCSPAVATGMVFIGDTGSFFYALELASGKEIWRLKTGPSVQSVDTNVDGGVVSSPVVVDGVVYFGSLDGKLYAVSASR